jgi:VWFA-related protein
MRTTIAIALLAVSAAAADLAAQADFTTEVRLVEIHATVLEAGKRYVPGLGRDAFEVLDEGAPQAITVFEADSAKLACAIVLDTTGSMQRALPAIKNAIAQFIDEFRELDEVSVYAFSSSLTRLQELTGDKRLAKQAVLSARADGQTALFNAVSQVIGDLEDANGKRTLLLFTDGDDNASAINAAHVIGQARKAGVPIYAVASGQALSNKELLKQLEELGSSTGGRSFELQKSKDAGEVFAEIMRDLRHTYLLAYKPPSDARGKWRNVTVNVRGLKKPVVRSKTGYMLR